MKPPVKASILNLSVEEQNLASIPFAILERRIGKRVSKLELKGAKVLPDGSVLRAVWQVQGNTDLGLPTEQDLDIFVALGVLTFRQNFSKTVTFTGREIAKILNISSVHGKFYQRLKLAMDRFIPLRFRAITESEREEQVKWCNVFQEASFMVDKTTGRCMGAITWTDKLIQSMDSGFFRVLDAGRYMELDGITAKHLYRFLVVAFEETDLVLIDARKLATEHLGIFKLPQYFSRLMQTLEPALDQLIGIQVVGSYHVVSAEDWRIALHRHPNYEPERKTLLGQSPAAAVELGQECCHKFLERCGFSPKFAEECAGKVTQRQDLYALERAGNLYQAMVAEGVLAHVATAVIKQAVAAGVAGEGRDILDWCEIALDVCRQKKRLGQKLSNAAGLVVKIVRDPAARRGIVPEQLETSLKLRFRQQEEVALRQEVEAEERSLIQDYEAYRQQVAMGEFDQLPDTAREALRKQKAESLRQTERFEKIRPDARSAEIDTLILQDIARKHAPPYEKWLARRRVQQTVLPFLQPEVDSLRAYKGEARTQMSP
jgi:hypothetical protein